MSNYHDPYDENHQHKAPSWLAGPLHHPELRMMSAWIIAVVMVMCAAHNWPEYHTQIGCVLLVLIALPVVHVVRAKPSPPTTPPTAPPLTQDERVAFDAIVQEYYGDTGKNSNTSPTEQ